MIGMIRILARISPGNVHLTRRQINDQRRNGTLPIKWIDTLNIVVTNRVRQVNMVFLDRLQSLDRVCGILSQ